MNSHYWKTPHLPVTMRYYRERAGCYSDDEQTHETGNIKQTHTKTSEQIKQNLTHEFSQYLLSDIEYKLYLDDIYSNYRICKGFMDIEQMLDSFLHIKHVYDNIVPKCGINSDIVHDYYSLFKKSNNAELDDSAVYDFCINIETCLLNPKIILAFLSTNNSNINIDNIMCNKLINLIVEQKMVCNMLNNTEHIIYSDEFEHDILLCKHSLKYTLMAAGLPQFKNLAFYDVTECIGDYIFPFHYVPKGLGNFGQIIDSFVKNYLSFFEEYGLDNMFQSFIDKCCQNNDNSII